MSNRIDWRFLLGEFVVIVLGVLIALWVDQLREARVNADLEVEYLESLIADLDADLAQFDEAEEWMRRSEDAAATVLGLYEGAPPSGSPAELVAAVETAGWQMTPSITRNTIDDLRSTGNLRLIRDAGVRRAIADYYTNVENALGPLAAMQERIWDHYDARVGNVLRPGERLAVLQGPGSFAQGITSDALEAAEPPDQEGLVRALQSFPELEVGAAEVLYQNVANRGIVDEMRTAATQLRGVLDQWLAAHR